ncbi:baseplate protein J-like protein [Vibrio phage 1.063.O._10N.261.45.C7]|nr:baseplate protein J-like protein [Vibrio phage 1.063.O._10N.261.45.C7]
MAGVTDNGWESKSFDQLMSEVATRAKEALGQDLPTTPDSPFGQFSNIFMASVKDLWDLGQSVTSTGNRDEASGYYLDVLARIARLTRLPASGSTGNLLFTGSVNATLPTFFACKDDQNRNVLTQEAITLNRANCYQSTFSVLTLADNTEYTIDVEGESFTFNGGTSPTVENVLIGLKGVLDTGDQTFNEIVGETIVLSFASNNNQLTTTNSDSLQLGSVGVLVSAESATVGDLSFPANTVTKLVSSNLSISSVTNPEPFNKGRFRETDEELRQRMSDREQNAGTATKPSIEASISQVDGVVSVLVVPNITMTDDPVTGVPKKSFETFVVGGDDDEIAEVLWQTKGVTSNFFGDILKIIIDENGDEQPVRFSRNVERYAWVRVTYSINSEEAFPADGEVRMASAVASHGNNMYLGEDLDPTKFYCPLYSVPGTYIKNIQVAITENETDPPVYQTTTIPVSSVEALSFSEQRVFITT